MSRRSKNGPEGAKMSVKGIRHPGGATNVLNYTNHSNNTLTHTGVQAEFKLRDHSNNAISCISRSTLLHSKFKSCLIML